MTENKLVDDVPEACPSLADTAAAVAEGQIAQALCGETLCPLPAEESYRCKALAGVKRIDNFDTLRDSVAEYMTADDVAKLERAYLFARRAHDGQYRKSGEPYIVHPVEVAIILSQLNMDMQTVTAALLHDVVEDCDVSKEEVARLFSPTVAELVDGVTKITRIEVETLTDTQVATIRKMLVAMSHDIRVIVIKLADRLHNMRTLMGLKEDRRIFKSKETMEIYAPLANRLGMNSLKWELEDLAFSYLEPSKYNQVKKMVNETREARESYIDNAVQLLEHELAAVGVSAKIYGRPKHLYSIYQKMTSQGKGFSEIYDLSAVRVIVNDIPGCYAALGAVHNMWKPLPGRFKDYIAMPKNNMYQSLHTTVIGPAGRPLEIQIRTEEMHHFNEYGIAAHWRYKEGDGSTKGERKFDEKMQWLREMLEWQQETDDPREFMEGLKVDLFDSEVFVFTPKGEVLSLKAGATPLDFAYSIHTEVGNHCVGAKINGVITPLTYQLQNGDRVEILTQKNASPSRDWLNLVQTPSARAKIRSYFSKVTRGDDLIQGRDVLAKELRKEGLGISNNRSTQALKQVADELSYSTVDEMMVAVGSGKASAKQITNKVMRVLNKDAAEEEQALKSPTLEQLGLTPGGTRAQQRRKRKAHNNNGVEVVGLDDVFVRLSRCCNPVPGDEIIGFITRGRGVSVHRADCPNTEDLRRDPERMIDVRWESNCDSSFQVEIFIEAIDRLRLLQDVTIFLADAGVNILSCQTVTHKDDIVEMRFLFEVSDTKRIDKILRDILGVEGVFGARRMLPGTSAGR